MFLSVTSQCCSEMVRRIELIFWHAGFFRPILLVLEGNSGTYTKRYFHLETLSQPLARHSSQCVVDLARQRWMHSVINWIVVGRTKLTILATIDGQFITLSVHLSVYSTMHARQSVARVHLRQLILVCLTPLWSEDRIESRYTNWTGR